MRKTQSKKTRMNSVSKTLISVYPFTADVKNLNVVRNSTGNDYDQKTFEQIIKKENPDYIIAGIEKYEKEQLDLCPNLKAISRVGIGLSSIDLNECQKRGISVFNTPDAPTNAVSDMALCFILMALRKIHLQKVSPFWEKYKGKELKNCTVGIVGFGRTGKSLKSKLESLCVNKILIHDPYQNVPEQNQATLRLLFEESDVISFHTPKLQKELTYYDFNLMKADVCIVNTARGEIFNESDLYDFLKKAPDASAMLDVFGQEPYTKGNLLDLDNTFCTPHISSFTDISRADMESGAVQNLLNFIK